MKSKTSDRLATSVFITIALIIIALLVGLFYFILVNGFKQISLHFLTTPSSSLFAGGGIRDQLFNSFYIVFITMVMTVPLGLGGGIYLVEYAKPGRITSTIRSCVEMLSSLPSIVIGMFGLLVFVTSTGWGYTIIGGALSLTIINIPVMVRVCEDAIRAVPQDLKEASLALGITNWDTIRTVLIPSALPSIITGAILAAGRVSGEAAALLYTAGQSAPILNYADWNPFSPTSPLNIFRPAETLAVHIWAVNTQGLIPDARAVANGASAILVLAVFLFNLLARGIGALVYKKMTATK